MAKHKLGKDFEDHRGYIHDLVAGPLDMITEITTNKGEVRGNHIHYQTTQWVYVVKGRMLVVHAADVGLGLAEHRQEYVEGDLIEERPGVAHAWKAIEDTRVLVFTRGPRSGEDFEEDTYRLEKSLL